MYLMSTIIGWISLAFGIIIALVIFVSPYEKEQAERYIQLWQAVGLFFIAAAICFR